MKKAKCPKCKSENVNLLYRWKNFKHEQEKFGAEGAQLECSECDCFFDIDGAENYELPKKKRASRSKMSKVYTLPESDALVAAAARTWGYIESDARALGRVTIAGAIELVMDAGRIVTMGKLPRVVADKLDGDNGEAERILKLRKSEWMG